MNLKLTNDEVLRPGRGKEVDEIVRTKVLRIELRDKVVVEKLFAISLVKQL